MAAQNDGSFLVSVIVPVYNVEPYIKKCIESIRNQTYDNLEIILIDDGSADNSGKICDMYQMDTRIKVIHQKNQGVSRARNTGLDQMSGDYVLFVDSDDYIHKDLVFHCIEAVKKYNADIVTFNSFTIKNGKETMQSLQKHLLQNRDTYYQAILEGSIPCYVWNKFYKSELWQDTRMAGNTDFEDLLVMPFVIKKVNSVYLLDEALYYYNGDNNGSITHNISPKSKYGLFKSFETRIPLSIENGMKEYSIYCRYRAIRSAVGGIGLNFANPLLTMDQRQDMLNYLAAEEKKADRPRVGLKYELLFYGALHAPWISRFYGKSMYGIQRLKKLFSS